MKPRASLNGPRLCFAVFLVAAILAMAGGAAEPASSGGALTGRQTISEYLTRPAFKPITLIAVTTNAPASPWGYWLARSGTASASVTNQIAVDLAEPNDCVVCKDLPKPRKCCGVCGRANECELCATGVHPFPGGLKGDAAADALGKKARAKKVACISLDCDLRAQPRPCCGYCNNAYECALCVLRKHDPGGKPPTGRVAIFTTWQPAFSRPLNTSGTGPFCPPVKCVTDCMFRDIPRDCCGHCMQMYECKKCAAGLHLPGDVKWVDVEGNRLVSSGKPGYMRRSPTQGLGQAQGAKSAEAKTGPNGQSLGGNLLVWETDRQLRGATNRPLIRP